MKPPTPHFTKGLPVRMAALFSAAALLPAILQADGPYHGQPPKAPADNAAGADAAVVRQRKKESATAKAIEALRTQIEEWGTVNVSEMLIYPVDDQFKLDKDENFPTAKDYITAERTNVSAAVSQLSEKIFTGRAAVNFKETPPALPTGGATTKGTGSTAPATGTTAQPAGSTTTGSGSDAATMPDLPQLSATDYLSKKTFEPLGGLFAAGTTMTIPERQAVLLGTGDKITELLARKLANPPKPADGRKLYLAIFQVTCNPGWRTLQGYMADVFINMEYAQIENHKPVRLSLDEDNTQCSVVAALPLVDAQNMELRNGQREMVGLLAALSASGAVPAGSAAGKGVAEYVNRYQKDSASRNAMPVVNSYATGKGLGFRFSPSFLAIGDPTQKKGRAVNQLIPTSFPVLAIIAIDPKEVKGTGGKDGGGGYNALTTRVSNRWFLRDRRVSLLPWDWHMPKRRDDEARRLERTQAAMDAYKALGVSAEGGSYDDLTFQMQRTDLLELEQKLLGKWTYTALPAELFAEGPKAPSVTGIRPALINPDFDNVLVIRGSNFSGDGLKVFCGGRECEVASVPGPNVIIAIAKAGKFSTQDAPAGGGGAAADPEIPPPVVGKDVKPLKGHGAVAAAAPATPRNAEVVVVTKGGSSAGTVGLPPKKNDPPKPDDPTARSIGLKRDDKGRITALEFNETETIKGDKLIEAIGRILAPEESAPKVIIEKPQP